MIICLMWALALFSAASARVVPRASNDTYWAQRDALLTQDLSQMLGSDLTLDLDEQDANTYLMSLKDQEMTEAFQNLTFPPATNFLEAKPIIDASPVFQFIRDMPKGAVLHAHDMALTSIDWVVANLTYWNDLYICNTTDGYVIFMFFTTPDGTCPWKLVAQERASYSSPAEYDAYLYSLFTFSTTEVESTYPDINSIWRAFEQVFTSISGIVTYSKAWEAYLTQALQEHMEDNVLYLEFRGILPLLYEKDGRFYTEEETVRVYEDVIKNFTSKHSDTFYGARFIFAPSRQVDVATVWGYVDLVTQLRDLFPDTVAGFDLVGQEDLGEPLTAFIDPILTLAEKTPPVSVFFHAGETNWQGLSADGNIYDALLLNSSRIGHGYAIAKHPELVEKARQSNTPVEVCPISNQVLMLVKDLRNHPMATLAASNFPIVVSSDDPAIWKALPLSHDFYEAFMGIGGAKADLRFLKKLALNSIRYTSLNEVDKLALEVKWTIDWDLFIAATLLKNQEKDFAEMEKTAKAKIAAANEETNIIPFKEENTLQ